MPTWRNPARETVVGETHATDAGFGLREHHDGRDSSVLATAAERLLAQVVGQVPGEWDTALLSEDIARLAVCLDAPDFAPVQVQSGAESVLLRRVLELLRAEVIRCWQEAAAPPPADAMLELLSRFEAAREALEPSREAQFTAQLSSPMGLELVVEVAHDLRSPLTSILFLSEALRRGQSGAVSDVQQHQLGIIYSAALGLISIASDVIELARGGERLAEKGVSAFSLREIFEAVSDVVRPMAEEKQLTLELDLDVDPDSRLGYPIALSRVLLNLTTNALKFTEAGRVEISARTVSASQVRFGVRDSGSGIPQDVARQLYEPFRYVANRGGYDFSESGLGLAICRKLVDAMDAELCFDTRDREGTDFWFVLELPAA
jgi:signal transduction histidine kinase